MEEEGSDML